MLEIGVSIAERFGKSPSFRILGRRRHTVADDAAAVRYHHDVSNDFYRLWLDRNMVYSCAYFETGEEDLDTAQEQKLDHLCRKLRLQRAKSCWISAAGGVVSCAGRPLAMVSKGSA